MDTSTQTTYEAALGLHQRMHKQMFFCLPASLFPYLVPPTFLTLITSVMFPCVLH